MIYNNDGDNMKKISVLLVIGLMVISLCGCTSKEKEEAREICKKSAKEEIERYQDANIEKCYTTYDKEDKKGYTDFCLGGDKMYVLSSTLEKGSKYYDTYYNNYMRNKNYAENGEDNDYYYFEFSIDELK